MIDDRIIELLDRKYDFVIKAGPDRLVPETARFVEWLFTEDLVRPYAFELLDEDVQTRLRFIEHRAWAFAEGVRLRNELGKLYPDALKGEETLPEHDEQHDTSLTRFDRLTANPRAVEKEEEDLERSPEEDSTTVGALSRILQAQEPALRSRDESQEKKLLGAQVVQLHQVHEFRFRERRLRTITSPGRSFRSLLAYCRSQNPPPIGVDDWMPFLKRDRWKYAVLKSIFDENEGQARQMLVDVRTDLFRVYEALRALLGTSLSSVTLVSRFKERCTWFDKDRLRRLATGADEDRGVREDRLTMELARYLHDNGVFSLVRSRMANLEPDAIAPFGPRRLAVESKVHDKGDSAKGAIRRGFWQLHAYLTSLETKTVRAHEGFLIVFRLGGGLCDAPPVVALNRFRIHIVPIDLGEAEDSGHAQPKPSQVGVGELIEVVKQSETPPEAENE
jgi:hypothetical protein